MVALRKQIKSTGASRWRFQLNKSIQLRSWIGIPNNISTTPQINHTKSGEGITVTTHPHPKNNTSSTPTPTIIHPPNGDASDPPPCGKRVLPHPSKICPNIVPATSRAGEDLCPSVHPIYEHDNNMRRERGRQ